MLFRSSSLKKLRYSWRFTSPSSRGLGHRPFTAVTRVQIPLGTRVNKSIDLLLKVGPVAQLVSAPPCHGGGRGFKSRLGRYSPRLGSSVGTSVRLKIVRSTVRSRPQPHIFLFNYISQKHNHFILSSVDRFFKDK